jgi:hypothetical protein
LDGDHYKSTTFATIFTTFATTFATFAKTTIANTRRSTSY